MVLSHGAVKLTFTAKKKKNGGINMGKILFPWNLVEVVYGPFLVQT